jgi:hypothetical protein
MHDTAVARVADACAAEQCYQVFEHRAVRYLECMLLGDLISPATVVSSDINRGRVDRRPATPSDHDGLFSYTS